MIITYQEAKKIAVSFLSQIEQDGYKQIYYWKLAYICF